MPVIRLIRKLRASVDAFDVAFGMFPWFTGYAAFVVWAKLIVRAIRGEEVSADWRVTVATAAHLASRAMASATEARETVALRTSVLEMETALREAAVEAKERDKRAAALQDQLYRVTIKMAWVAALTLAAAVGSVIVAFMR